MHSPPDIARLQRFKFPLVRGEGRSFPYNYVKKVLIPTTVVRVRCGVLTIASVAMASSPVDPLQILQAALTAQANSKEQADLLAVLRETLENHPKPIPILLQTLISNFVHATDSLLKRWVLDLFHYAICRSNLTLDQKTHSSS